MSSRPPRNRTEYMMSGQGSQSIREAICACDGPVGVMLCFKPDNLPNAERLEELMSGFDDWGVMTADSPSDEMAARNIGSSMMCHVTDEVTAVNDAARGAITGSGA